MNYFRLATAVSPMPLSSLLGTANRSISQSTTLFVVMVSLAAIGCLLAMAGLAGGLRMPKKVTINSVGLAVLLVAVVFLLALMLRRWTARSPARARVNQSVPVRRAAEKPPSLIARTAVGKSKGSTAKSRGGTTQTTRPDDLPVRLSSSKPSGESPVTQTARSEHHVAKAEGTEEAMQVPQGPAEVEPPSKNKSIVLHGARVLSDSQSKRVCNAVSLFAGAEVYIKWSPGGNAEQLASQLSQVLDCARVTVTYASESSGMQGHGVRVGTHANEGETSDRIRPFADAITDALRAQGFNVSEVTGPNIPANQTAIFIGSD